MRIRDKCNRLSIICEHALISKVLNVVPDSLWGSIIGSSDGCFCGECLATEEQRREYYLGQAGSSEVQVGL